MPCARRSDAESISRKAMREEITPRIVSSTIASMANLTLVYGMRLLPADELGEIEDASLTLKNGKTAHVTMHVLEGSKEDIEKQLRASTEAFFDFYPEV